MREFTEDELDDTQQHCPGCGTVLRGMDIILGEHLSGCGFTLPDIESPDGY